MGLMKLIFLWLGFFWGEVLFADTQKDVFLDPPRPWKGGFADFFDDDFDGLIEKARTQVDHWEQQSAFNQQWKMDDSPIYRGPKEKDKKRFVGKIALKYLDKKIMDKGHRSPKNSAAHGVVSLRQAMTPTSTIGLNENIKMKFRAKLLEGNLSLYLLNPFLDSWFEFNNHGHLSLTLKKTLEDVNLEALIFFTTQEHTVKGHLKQKLMENVFGNYEMTQKSSRPTTDHRLSVNYLLVF